ncbi:P1 family peptidase [Nocardioides carbamazepini]|nr:P1 family peptidase [Nocardioides carbamazepini]
MLGEFGRLPTGPQNAITDVTGVRVGHATLHDDSCDIHSGVTAVVHDRIVGGDGLPAGLFVGNGYGKLTGTTQIAELGVIETPILLTSTLSTFRVADALITWLQRRARRPFTSVNPVVGEVNDSWLSPGGDRPIGAAQVFQALDSAMGDGVQLGNVGGGAGACALGFKAGIGSSSRQIRLRGRTHTLGVLVQANMSGELRLGNQRITPHALGLPAAGPVSAEGSCVVLVALDAPCSAGELCRIARRAVFGLGRIGADYSHGSGDYGLSFTTESELAPALSPSDLDTAFTAVLDAVEESVADALLAATTVRLSDGRTAYALPHEAINGERA